MLSTTLLGFAAFMPQGPSTAPVVINEVSYDDSSTDDREFVEIYNRSGAAVDISGWVLDGEDPAGPNSAYTVPAATMLAAGGFYVFGPSTGTVPNVNQAVGTTNLWENSNEVIYLRDASLTIIDSFTYELNDGVIPGQANIEGMGLYGDYFNIDLGMMCMSRHSDGWDSDVNGRDFRLMPQTPGATNAPATFTPYVGLYDSTPVGSTVFDFGVTWVDPLVIDPAVIDPNNPTVKPPSPQGGNALSLFDPAGGGAVLSYPSQALENVVMEGYFYVEPPMTAPTYVPTDGESWAFGVRGGTDSNGDAPNIDGYDAIKTFSDQPGVTGLAVYYIRTTPQTRVYLVDLGEGGGINQFNIIGQIDIVAGVNDGWQRIRLHAHGNQVQMNYGGTFGCADGTVISGTTNTTGIGGQWLVYREAVIVNATLRPITFDQLVIVPSSSEIEITGTSSPTNSGLPAIGVSGLPVIGNAGFAITGTGMRPNGFSGMLLGFSNIPGGTPVPGAPATVLQYVIPTTSVLSPNTATGTVSYALPIPCDPNLAGLQLFSQLADIDPSLGGLLPVGTSEQLRFVIGS